MESRVKFLGHPVHPMLIVLPLGLLPASVIFDIAAAVMRDGGRFHEMAYYLIAAGVVGGLLAAVFGLIDWIAVPRGSRAKAVGLWHMASNVAALTLFIISWLLRNPTPADPGAIPIILSVIALSLNLLGGWFGGELVDRLGVGVDAGANINAPSSLSGRTATDTVATATSQTQTP